MNGTVFYPVYKKGVKRIAKMDLDDFLNYSDRTHTVKSPKSGIWYVSVCYDYKENLLHRIIMNPCRNMVVDHINGDGLDNRKSNLRVCTQAKNLANKRKNKYSKSRYKGVVKQSNGSKFVARCKDIYLGSFVSEHEAAAAYNKKALELFGEYAYINKITREV